ncbi:rhomboid family intramembrane serine protease [Celeribacter arenosi]|uniref:Rhomboid family intramembrane serine protease n=2 Tax=Celeribacter arenosi TaxID=792649 RepID=A0ABP7KAP1_9RHOB
MAVNIAVFLAMLPAYADDAKLIQVFSDYALVPARISAGEGYFTFVTSTFMHGGFMHIAGNMLFLWIFGDNLEDEMGHIPYLGFYLICGFAAGFAQYIAAPHISVPMVGASGAIAGVMGGYLLLFPKARVDVLFIFIVIFKVIPFPAWLMLGIWFGLQVFGGLGASSEGGGVAYLAHAGGFIAGVLLAHPLWQRLGGIQFWNRHHGHPPHAAARYRFEQSNIPSVRRRR